MYEETGLLHLKNNSGAGHQRGMMIQTKRGPFHILRNGPFNQN